MAGCCIPNLYCSKAKTPFTSAPLTGRLVQPHHAKSAPIDAISGWDLRIVTMAKLTMLTGAKTVDDAFIIKDTGMHQPTAHALDFDVIKVYDVHHILLSAYPSSWLLNWMTWIPITYSCSNSFGIRL
jgi:hypothetical protein